MTITIYEFGDTSPGNDDPVYPAQRRRTGLALANTYHPIGNTSPTAAILIYNDSATTGVHVRIGTQSSGENADQGDTYIGPDGTGYFLIRRKRRTADEATDRIYINAVADT